MKKLSKSDKIDLFLEEALVKMFEIVNVKYSEEFTSQKQWYLKHSWSEKQNDEFRIWFISAMREQLKYPKYKAEKEYQWFNFNFGWKNEEN